jgi:hypothetical protein
MNMLIVLLGVGQKGKINKGRSIPMYRVDRETYYKNLLALYSKYIPQDMIIGHYHNEVVYIDTYSRMMYNTSGQAVLQFRH